MTLREKFESSESMLAANTRAIDDRTQSKLLRL
jgi:hypothetical protein